MAKYFFLSILFLVAAQRSGIAQCPASVKCEASATDPKQHHLSFSKGFGSLVNQSPYAPYKYFYGCDDPRNFFYPGGIGGVNTGKHNTIPSNGVSQCCDCGTNPNPTVKVFFEAGLTCSYKDGKLEPQNPCDACINTNADFLKKLLDDFTFKFQLLPIPPKGCHVWKGSCGTSGLIERTGSVGIGVSSVPSGFSLAVKGTILTEQYRVQTGWADYVFAPNYRLRPLPEIAEYIDKNGHLPNFPSNEQIKTEQGIEVVKTIVQQQVSIEELFLHLIEMDKRLENNLNKTN